MADPTDRHLSQCQLYKPRSKPASHLTRSAKLGCKGNGEAEQGPSCTEDCLPWEEF